MATGPENDVGLEQKCNMADPRQPVPVLLVVAVFSRHAEALIWAKAQLEAHFGPVALTSPEYEFSQTRYYEPTMGPGVHKLLHAFRDLIAPDRLAAIKVLTNRLESELAGSRNWPEPRPLNLDPGILTLGKFMLATTKDQAHRIYLQDGIFAEVTLRYQAGAFVPWDWTYRDYREPLVLDFLQQARELYRERLQSGIGSPQRQQGLA